jgi:hypothetical protein
MSLWSWLFGSTSGTSDSDVHSTTASHATGAVNPATGLPMVSGDSTGIDIGGSPFGVDLHSNGTSTGCDSFGSFDSWSS